MEWYDDELGTVVTERIDSGINEEGVPYTETVELPILDDEVFLMPSIPYLMFFTQQIKLPILIQMFSTQFVSDNSEIWTKLK